MTDSIKGLPFWEIRFDSDGDPDGALADTMVAEVPGSGITDLYVFAHGWNNDPGKARRLYDGFLALVADQLATSPAAAGVRAGFAGVVWPSKRWSDEPIPDFTPAAATLAAGAATVAADAPAAVATSELDARTLADLRETFPAAAGVLDRMAALLAGASTEESTREFFACLKEFSALTEIKDENDEGDPEGSGSPRMLRAGDPAGLFETYRVRLEGLGVVVPGGSATASFADKFRGALTGAKEALRQLTYWQMKSRAGVVGRRGLGPVLGRLHGAGPGLRVHLIGHSFGARLVSYALAGLPEGLTPSPVKSVTLLQGAFSHFAFDPSVSFDPDRHGELAGMQARIDGPLTVCFSRHDAAVGTFYPLASIASGEDLAGVDDPLYRWGGMGHDGAQNADARLDQVTGVGGSYRFSRTQILNVDASAVVNRGGPPSGAHSDIVRPELAWVVLAASRS